LNSSFVRVAQITLGTPHYLKNNPAVFDMTRADTKITLMLKLNHFITLVYVLKTEIDI
jgi:hypothetical protein